MGYYSYFDESADYMETDDCRNCKHSHPVFSWGDVNKCLECGCCNYETSDNLEYLEKKYEASLVK